MVRSRAQFDPSSVSVGPSSIPVRPSSVSVGSGLAPLQFQSVLVEFGPSGIRSLELKARDVSFLEFAQKY